MKYFKRILKYYLILAPTRTIQIDSDAHAEIDGALDDLEEYIKEQVKVQVLLHERIYHDG